MNTKLFKFGSTLALLSVLGLLAVPANRTSTLRAEEVRGSKGPDGDAIPDLDGITAGKGPTADSSDGDSLGDLEKVITDEDNKGAGAAEKAQADQTASSKSRSDQPPAEAKSEPPPEEIPKQSQEDLGALEKDLKAESKGSKEPPAGDPGEGAEAPPRDTSALTDDKTAAGAPPPDNKTVSTVTPSTPEPLPDDNGSAEKNAITNLEFKMEGKNSRIIISSQNKLNYRETPNSKMRQFVYFFDNADTPEHLQRAYDTTEFPSPIALFTLLQMPGSSGSKLIVQLRENQRPNVMPNDRGLIIEFPPPTEGSDTKVTVGDGDQRALTDENIYSGKQVYSGHIIRRLEIKNSDVQDVLRLIARVSGYSIVVGDDVNGKVGTLSLENIPWDQAFTLVLQMKKLGYVREGNVLRVATNQALKAEKDEALAIEQAKLKLEPLKTVLIPVSFANADQVAPKTKTLLTDRGTVDTDKRSNTVIVKDVERVIERVQKLITALDTPPARVSISAKFVEVANTFTRALGLVAADININPGFAGLNIEEAVTGGGGGAAVTTLTAAQNGITQLQLGIGETENKTHTLANPSVSVIANETATITQTQSFFLPTSTFVAGVGLEPGVQQINANLTLNVTPIVSSDGSIFMKVHVTNQIPKISGINSTIDSRDIDTQVMIENGDTAVLGGIFRDQVNHSSSGIPLLDRIPILGYLFGGYQDEDDRNELFIFLTGKIMNADEAFKRNI